MARILCIETTTTNCSVAIGQDGKLVALVEDMGRGYSHSERLHSYIAQALEKAGLTKGDIEAIAVSKGPGSYTGLRIGISSAKGLCFALEIPLIAIDTLQALTAQVKEKSKYVIPLLDARRMEVYSAVFDSDGQRIRETQAKILNAESFLNFLDTGKTVFIGNGVEKFAEICQHPHAVFMPDALPSAREMTAFAEAKYKTNTTEDVAYFEPYYLKDFLITKSKK